MIGSSRVPDLRTESGGAAGIIVRRFGIPVISHFQLLTGRAAIFRLFLDDGA
jgi:hypothetical protein